MKIFVISDTHTDHYLGIAPKKTDAVKALLEPHLVPADAIVVAGDIANTALAAITTLAALSEMYPKVLWVEGNHDWAITADLHQNSGKKIQAIIDGLSHLPNVHHLRGPHKTVELGTHKIGGSMGQCDFSYAIKNHNTTRERMQHSWKNRFFDGRYWNIGLRTHQDILDEQLGELSGCVDAGCDIMVSHFGPLAADIPRPFQDPTTGFFYFDGTPLLARMLRPGIWAHGHTHDHILMDHDGVLIACNPFGYPDEKRRRPEIPKEHFLLELDTPC